MCWASGVDVLRVGKRRWVDAHSAVVKEQLIAPLVRDVAVISCVRGLAVDTIHDGVKTCPRKIPPTLVPNKGINIRGFLGEKRLTKRLADITCEELGSIGGRSSGKSH